MSLLNPERNVLVRRHLHVKIRRRKTACTPLRAPVRADILIVKLFDLKALSFFIAAFWAPGFLRQFVRATFATETVSVELQEARELDQESVGQAFAN